MKAILMSIQPKWCELIASGKKTVEVRKTKPKLDVPFRVYMYCTNSKEMLWVLRENERAFTPEKIATICAAKNVGGAYKANGKVIGEFVCDKLVWVLSHPDAFAGHPCYYTKALEDACMTEDEAETYSSGADVYGYHISDLVIYDKPKRIGEFCKPCDRDPLCDCNYCKAHGRSPRYFITRPPQSWCYVEEVTP